MDTFLNQQKNYIIGWPGYLQGYIFGSSALYFNRCSSEAAKHTDSDFIWWIHSWFAQSCRQQCNSMNWSLHFNFVLSYMTFGKESSFNWNFNVRFLVAIVGHYVMHFPHGPGFQLKLWASIHILIISEWLNATVSHKTKLAGF